MNDDRRELWILVAGAAAFAALAAVPASAGETGWILVPLLASLGLVTLAAAHSRFGRWSWLEWTRRKLRLSGAHRHPRAGQPRSRRELTVDPESDDPWLPY